MFTPSIHWQGMALPGDLESHLTVVVQISQYFRSILGGRSTLRLINYFIVSFILFASAIDASAARILILPFEIQSSSDLSFLQKGVGQMLASRLSSDDSIEILNPETQSASKPFGDSAALSTATKFKADYVSYGSITVTSDSVRTDARLIRISDALPLVVFSQTGSNQGDALQHVKLYAADILKSLGSKSAGLPQPAAVPSSQQQAALDETHRHPDTLWTGEIATGSSPIRMMTSDGKTEAAVWKSPKFRFEIKSLAIGDILGSKQNELVMINDTSISLYRYVDGKIELIEEVPGEMDHTPIRVDVADINGNGRAEIFVTNLYHDKTQIKSYVLEWDGSNLVRIAQDLNWYFKVTTDPGKKPVLTGQQREIVTLFSKGIYQLSWVNGTYAESSLSDSPRGMPLYAFSSGNALNDGTVKTVALATDLRLRVFDPAGDMEWTSAEQFMGGGTYMPYPQDLNENRASGEQRIKRYYLPQRLVLYDIDNDKKNEVILLSNKDYARNLLPNLRIFKSGRIECLQWEGLAFASKWRTTEVSGQISDMVVGDLNNDGIAEIVYSVVDTPGMVFNTARSYLVSWQIGK